MTRQQIIEEIKRLSVAERVALIETISRGLREEMGGSRLEHGDDPGGSESVGAVGGAAEASLARELYGALRFDGPPPTDEEVKEIISEYLSEKYS